MIRYAVKNDRDAVLNIWRVSFGDSESYINFYLDARFENNNCLVWEENGVPVAMLHLLNADYRAADESVPVLYIYAAATLPDFRGKGIMANLLQTAEKIGIDRGCRFTFLLPANDLLCDYYARLGYKTAFYVKKARLKRGALEETVKDEAAPRVNNSGAEFYEEIYLLRREQFKTAVLWQKPELLYALSEWQFTGGEILKSGSLYALCRSRGSSVEVRESNGSFIELAKILLSHFSSNEFTFYFPPFVKMPFDTETLRFGMLKPSENYSDILEKVISANPYVNLMLE